MVGKLEIVDKNEIKQKLIFYLINKMLDSHGNYPPPKLENAINIIHKMVLNDFPASNIDIYSIVENMTTNYYQNSRIGSYSNWCIFVKYDIYEKCNKKVIENMQNK